MPLQAPAIAQRRSLATDWSSLPRDIIGIIADRLLVEDVTDYMIFRGVCSHWRATTTSPCDPTLQETRFRPRGWVALCDGDGVMAEGFSEVRSVPSITGFSGLVVVSSRTASSLFPSPASPEVRLSGALLTLLATVFSTHTPSLPPP